MGGGVRHAACFNTNRKSLSADVTLGFLFLELKEIALNHTVAQPCLLGHWEKTLSLCCHWAYRVERKKNTFRWEVSGVLIQNTLWNGPNIFPLCCPCLLLGSRLHWCPQIIPVKFFYSIKEGGNFHLINQRKTLFLLTLDPAPSVRKFQLICTRCKFHLTERKVWEILIVGLPSWSSHRRILLSNASC